jgi:pyrroline-5-carboxylate reductase
VRPPFVRAVLNEDQSLTLGLFPTRVFVVPFHDASTSVAAGATIQAIPRLLQNNLPPQTVLPNAAVDQLKGGT